MPVRRDRFALWHDGAVLQLRQAGDKQGVWQSQQALAARRQGEQLLAKACNLGAGQRLFDAMAGWGTDGLLVANPAVQLVQVERSRISFALLQDLYWRLGRDPFNPDLICTDSWRLLSHAAQSQANLCDVLYLDPMFAQRRKGALPSKPMQYLQALADWEQAAIPLSPRAADHLGQWVSLGQRVARQRVVLKRRAKDPVTAQPDWQLRGRGVRYDVYTAGR